MSFLDAVDLEAEMEAEDRINDNAQEAVKILEERFADRYLEFTQNFTGACPVQAFGNIDGMRFYFRLRHGVSSLDVGKRDLAKAEEDNDKHIDRLLEKLDKNPDDVLLRSMINQAKGKDFHEDDSVIPEIIVKTSKIDVSEQDLDGVLVDVDEFVNVFSNLVDSLTIVE